MRALFFCLAVAALPLSAQEIASVSGVPLETNAGSDIGYVFEAWLSPHQEGGEEEDTPAFIPSMFKSTAMVPMASSLMERPVAACMTY